MEGCEGTPFTIERISVVGGALETMPLREMGPQLKLPSVGG